MSVTLHRYGEDAILADLGVEDRRPSERAAYTAGFAEALGAALPEADVVVGGGVVAVVGVGFAAARAAVEGIDREGVPAPLSSRATRKVNVVYDGADLSEVGRTLGMSPSAIAREHASYEYIAELVGFLPGFAYLVADGPSRLRIPRRPSPRPVVPALSIGIAGPFTGIYPIASPGGWNLIGRATGLRPFEPEREPASWIKAGERVIFQPVDPSSDGESPFTAGARPEPPLPASERNLIVITAPPCATLQDRGRKGVLRHGISPSGPLDPEMYERAIARAGGPDGAAAIEIPLGPLTVEAKGTFIISIDGEDPMTLHDGERLTVPTCERAVRYLAAEGGFNVPLVMGARATLRTAQIGGVAGRALRKRDRIPVYGSGGTTGLERALPRFPVEDDRPLDAPLRVVPGPHLTSLPEGAFEMLLSSVLVISPVGDRVGVRLDGARIPRDRPDLALPAPMIRGAIEVTTDGTPIVLGPDHPTTGGYPVIAVLSSSDFGRFARKKPGDEVRFELG